MGLNYLSSSDNFCPFSAFFLYKKKVVYNLKKRTKNNSASDYMLETILFEYYLLFIYTFYLYKLDVSKNRGSSFLLNSKNNDTTIGCKLMNIQSAENCKGFSETVRQLPNTEEYKF